MKQLELRQTPSDIHWSIWYKDAKENIPQNIFVPVLPKEDAELIVKAVNNHDLLVALLNEVQPILAGAACSSKASDKYSDMVFNLSARIDEAIKGSTI